MTTWNLISEGRSVHRYCRTGCCINAGTALIV